MTRKKSRSIRASLTKKTDVKKDSKPSIRSYLSRTLIISILASYLGYLQYGYSFILVHHPASLHVANLTEETAKSSKTIWVILSPAVIFFPMGGVTGIVLFANLVDRYGRKCLLLLNNTLAFFASVFLSISNIIQLFSFTLFANFIIGISSGIFSCCVPLYLLEVSPTPIRGSITTAATIFFSLGALLCHILGLPKIWGNKEGFPLMAIVLGMVATICIFLLLFCPESPRLILIQKRNETKAREVLRSLRTQEDVGNEIRELQEEDFYEVMANEKKMNLRKFLRIQKFRWPIVTVIVLMAGSQLSGINGMFFYVRKVYMTTGFPGPVTDIISTTIHLIMIITVVITAGAFGFVLLQASWKYLHKYLPEARSRKHQPEDDG